MEKYGFNLETRQERLYSPELDWVIPFTKRRDHIPGVPLKRPTMLGKIGECDAV